MNHVTKTLLALAIVTAGTGFALLFYRRGPAEEQPKPVAPERLISRGSVEPVSGQPVPLVFPVVRLQTSAGVGKPGENGVGAVPRAMEPAEPPPPLARSFSGPDPTVAARWGTMLGLLPAPPDPAGQPARTHKVRDGDTLKALAERYLGNPDRFAEIYEANRELLPNCEVLPIGVELRIPPRDRPAPPALTPLRPSPAKTPE